jgi:hypothetical protein
MDECVRRMEAIEPGTPWAAAMTGIRRLFSDLEPSLMNLLEAYRGGIRDDTDVLGWLALGCAWVEHHEAADRFAAELDAIDPQGTLAVTTAHSLTLYRGRFVEAAEVARKLSDTWFKVILRGWSEAAAGNVQAALSSLAETPEGESGSAGALADVLRAGLDHRVDDVAASVASGVLAASDNDFVGAMYLADVYAILGDRSMALHWLRRALEMGCCMPDFLGRYNPFLADLRDEPEFQSIVKRARLGSIRMRAEIDRRLAGIE